MYRKEYQYTGCKGINKGNDQRKEMNRKMHEE